MDHFHRIRRPNLHQIHQQPFNLHPIHLVQGEVVQGSEKIPDDALVPFLSARLPALNVEAVPFLNDHAEGSFGCRVFFPI
jgi:hypothetical protein